MPKKPILNPQFDKYLVVWHEGHNSHPDAYLSAQSAVNAYRKLRESVGDNVCLAKVVVDYGEEI